MGMLKPERIAFEDFAEQHLSICGKAFVAHKFGALYWPGEDALIVPTCISKRARPLRRTGKCCRPRGLK